MPTTPPPDSRPATAFAATGAGAAAARAAPESAGTAAERIGLDVVLAQGLMWLLGAVAVVVGIAGGVPELLGQADAGSRSRLVLAAVLGLGVGAARLLVRADRPRTGAIVLLVLTLVSANLLALLNGVGPYSQAVAAATVCIAFAGVLGRLGPAVGLVALQAALSLGLIAVHVGAVPGWTADASAGASPHAPAGAGVRDFGEHLLAQALLLACGLLGAYAASRIVGRCIALASAGERRLADILAVANDWMFEADADGRLTWLSPSFESRTGRRVEEFLRVGEPGGPRIVEDASWQRLRVTMGQCRAYRDAIIRFVCADGTELAVSGCGEPRFDDEGRLIGWWGASRNVTADVQAQRELDRSRALLDSLVRLSPDAICVARLDDGRILFTNPAFVALAGYPEAAILGRSAAELGLWQDPGDAQRLRDALAATGSVRGMRSRVRAMAGPEAAPDGATAGAARAGPLEVREAVLSAAAFDDDDGRRLAVITVRDVSGAERARLEADAILDNASVGIALVRQRRFERVNPLFETMLGFMPGTLAGRSTALLFPDAASHAAFAERAAAATAAGHTVDFVRELPRADGSTLVLRLRARAVDTREPLARGTIWLAEDITERRAAERELARARRDAEAASRAKSDFLATMSHEIRTPLNGVLGLARLLKHAQPDEERRRVWVGHLLASAELLAGLVSDVLDLSKIEAGHLELERIGLDLHELVAATWAGYEPLGLEKGLAMRCTVAPEVPRRVLGDPVRLRQVMSNYLANALKFTASGAIELVVDVPGPGRVRLAVRDTGVGVPPEVQPRLFRPFAQADGSTTRRFGGTGLGLSICRELVERMSGRVGVESDGHGGSTFWAEVALPAETPPDDDPPVAAEPAPRPAAAAPPPLAGLQVLVAEDNPVNMLIVTTLLQHLGARTVEATDGAQAVAQALAHAGTLDAVLMDLHMPLQDGLAATRRLRADPRTAALPVFAISAAVLDNERSDAAEAGMNGFIAKPVSAEQLLRALGPLAAPGRETGLHAAAGGSGAPC